MSGTSFDTALTSSIPFAFTGSYLTPFAFNDEKQGLGNGDHFLEALQKADETSLLTHLKSIEDSNTLVFRKSTFIAIAPTYLEALFSRELTIQTVYLSLVMLRRMFFQIMEMKDFTSKNFQSGLLTPQLGTLLKIYAKEPGILFEIKLIDSLIQNKSENKPFKLSYDTIFLNGKKETIVHQKRGFDDGIMKIEQLFQSHCRKYMNDFLELYKSLETEAESNESKAKEAISKLNGTTQEQTDLSTTILESNLQAVFKRNLAESLASISRYQTDRRALWNRVMEASPLPQPMIIQALEALSVRRHQSSRRQILKEIETNPQNATAYLSLAHSLGSEEKVTLNDGTIMTPYKLYLKAFELNPKDFFVNSKLFMYNTTKKDLLLKIIELNPKTDFVYNILANLLKENEEVTLNDGTVMTKRKLLQTQIENGSVDSGVYGSFAQLLKEDEGNIKLTNGKDLSKRTAYLKAYELNPEGLTENRNLLNNLKFGEKITLEDGTVLYEKVLKVKVQLLEKLVDSV